MTKRMSIAALLMIALFRASALAEESPAFELVDPNDMASAFTGVVYATIDDDTPESVVTIFCISNAIDELLASSDAMTVDAFVHKLSEYEIPFERHNAGNSTVLVFSDYIQIFINDDLEPAASNDGYIYDIKLRVTVPATITNDDRMHEVWSDLLIYRYEN